MKRLLILCLLLTALPAVAAVEGGVDHGEDRPAVKLRGWYLGVQGVSGGRDNYDVFGRPDVPPAPVEDSSGGGGFVFGRRFGGRFLLGLQLTGTLHELQGAEDELIDTEFLVTGTVLFRERSTLQPFLRGGFGGAVNVLRHDGGGDTVAFGPATVAGGGVQVRLSSRFSLELEGVATFTNIMEVHYVPNEGPEEDWNIRRSQVGGRIGVGVMVWF